MNRTDYANLIFDKLKSEKLKLQEEFYIKNRIQTCIIDNLLPEEMALAIFNAFPSKDEMAQRKSLRENKRVAAQLDKYNSLIEEITFAFQDERILAIISELTGLQQLEPDSNLYAGGISLMSKGNFLRPHLDNSHDMFRDKYRVLNLLYYVTPDWKEEYGGNLELWDQGTKKKPRTIVSKFNRLAIMITNKSSFHSVSEVIHEGNRCCISNYYFSAVSAEGENYFHVTSFRGRNDEPIKNIFLLIDSKLRNFLRKIKKKGFFRVWHKYDK